MARRWQVRRIARWTVGAAALFGALTWIISVFGIFSFRWCHSLCWDLCVARGQLELRYFDWSMSPQITKNMMETIFGAERGSKWQWLSEEVGWSRFGFVLPSFEGVAGPPIKNFRLIVPHWLVVGPLAILTAPLWLICGRTKLGHCARCGYNLTGNVSGRCPECGHAIGIQSPDLARNGR